MLLKKHTDSNVTDDNKRHSSAILATVTALTFSSILSVSSGAYAQDNPPVQAIDLVNLFEKLSGQHPGMRKAHAAGICATATFTPNRSDEFKGAALISNGELPVSMRFSLGGGNPNADERIPGTRGVGIMIDLSKAGGGRHVFTGNNFPVFAGKDPATFHGFLSTLLPDENGQRDPRRTMAFIQKNPSVGAHAMWQQSAKTAASYANTQFFGLHTFFYRQNGVDTKYRWELVPSLGVKTLSKEDAAGKASAFLNDTLNQQLSEGDIQFDVIAKIGMPEDSVSDPSIQWPEERKSVSLGTITLDSVGGDGCVNTNFDPNILSSGFESSDDPVLRMRSAAYAISFGKRMSGQ